MKDEEIMLKMMYDKLRECFNADNSVPKWEIKIGKNRIVIKDSLDSLISLCLEYDETAEEWIFTCNCIPDYIITSINEIIEEINKEYPYPEITYEVYDRLVGKSCGEYADEADALSKLEYLLKIENSDFVIKKITKEVLV